MPAPTLSRGLPSWSRRVLAARSIPVWSRPRARRRWLGRRAVLTLVGVVLLVGIGGLAGGAWYFSNQLLEVTHTHTYSIRVNAITGNTVSLERTVDSQRHGVYGLDWKGGHGVIGAIVAA